MKFSKLTKPELETIIENLKVLFICFTCACYTCTHGQSYILTFSETGLYYLSINRRFLVTVSQMVGPQTR